MAILGMDPVEVTNLANQFQTAANDINQLIQSITSALNSTTWSGPDQQRFSSEWNGSDVAALRKAAQDLEQEHQYLMMKVQEQEQASAS